MSRVRSGSFEKNREGSGCEDVSEEGENKEAGAPPCRRGLRTRVGMRDTRVCLTVNAGTPP